MVQFLLALAQVHLLELTPLAVLFLLSANDVTVLCQLLLNDVKNSSGFLWNSSKLCFEMFTCLRFWSNMNKCGTHLADSFRISEYSSKMQALWWDATKISRTHLNLIFHPSSPCGRFFNIFWRVNRIEQPESRYNHLQKPSKGADSA